jgi:hypothetical protein
MSNDDFEAEIAEFLLATPLYTESELSEGQLETIQLIRDNQFQFDAHCVFCGKEATFRPRTPLGSSAARNALSAAMNPNRSLPFESSHLTDNQFSVSVYCHRKSHKYTIHYYLDENRLIKIGQYPSMEDVVGHELERFRQLLSKEDFASMKRASGLASHGIGIGSFVYLRRIFENLISKTHDLLDTPVAGFDTKRMDEKIGALKRHLPPALVRHKKTYGILSKGIHELSEEECLEFYPVLRAATLAILESDFLKKEKVEAEKRLEDELSKISATLSAK